MALAFSPSSLFPIQTVSSSSYSCNNLRKANLIPLTKPTTSHNSFRCLAQVATASNPVAELERSKHDLLRAAQDTQRGLVATADQRAAIEEALVRVEGYDAGSSIDLVKLDGTWRLHYTSAPDVLILFESAARLPFFFQVGQIYQKFECGDRSDGGIVRNVVRWSIPSVLEVNALTDSIAKYDKLYVALSVFVYRVDKIGQEQEGATLLVSANFSVISKRNIYLSFEEVAVENIKISEQLQVLIAPAILPRTFLNLQILQFIRAFRAQIPLRSPERRVPGGLYYLSYLDRDMLLGRAVGGGGVFVFTRAQPLI